ncbi:MAG: IS1 family transposase [Cyanobacteria bacterium P01_G01_bin.49]
MRCPFCDHKKAHKHGVTSKGSERYRCPVCRKTFTETFDTIYYRRHLDCQEVHTILQSHAEGSSLRGVSRISGRAYKTVVSLIRDASHKAQLVHNAEVQQIKTTEVISDEMWSFVPKKQKQCWPEELMAGDCWIGVSLAGDSGLILSARVGKHTHIFAEELVNNTFGKTDCQNWKTDGWDAYSKVLLGAINHEISKKKTQRLERTNGIIRQQTGRWHRRQNKFTKVWQQTEVTARLVVGYFNWIWINSRWGTTAAQRAQLVEEDWYWDNFAFYPTLF